jgi:glycine/D-amino acid oxidase-like deaminating enzyme
MVDAVIAGAGIAGAAVAWQLADRLGSTDAVLVDPHPPLSITSNRPEANYRDWWPQPAMAELADESLGLIDELQADGARIPMDRRGYLYVTADPVRAASLPDAVASRAALPGAGAEALDAATVASEYPHLAPGIRAGIRVPRAGSLDAVALGRAMLERAARRGVAVVRGSVVGIDRIGDRVEAVVIDGTDGRTRLPTTRFVNAAGPFALPLLAMAGADLEIETVLRQKAVFRDDAGVVPRAAPFTILLDGQELPWTASERLDLSKAGDARILGPLPGGIHVKPDDTAGATAIKLGWAWDQTPSAAVERPVCPPTFPRMVLLGAARAIPGLTRYLDDPPLVAHGGGFYSRMPDGQPVVGPIGPEGSFVVGALAGFGAMMAAGAGRLAASWLAGDRPTALMGALAPARFDDPAYRREIREGRIGTGEL